MAALRAVQALKLSREARGDRRSALEMFLWLPR
jgi:hypothetical protein